MRRSVGGRRLLCCDVKRLSRSRRLNRLVLPCRGQDPSASGEWGSCCEEPRYTSGRKEGIELSEGLFCDALNTLFAPLGLSTTKLSETRRRSHPSTHRPERASFPFASAGNRVTRYTCSYRPQLSRLPEVYT